MKEIPSELIEPFIVKFISSIIESIGYGYIQPTEARQMLKGVERFVSLSSGIHARLATGNVFYKINKMSDEQMIKTCKEVLEKRDLTTYP